MEALVSTQWLAENGGAGDLKILDASLFLPEMGRDARAEFADGHIPGARFMTLAAIADPDAGLPMMLPQDEAFADHMRALGIDSGDRVVLYDGSPLHSAARGWWMLRVFGAEQVAILDGGIARWQAEGRQLETGNLPYDPGDFATRSDRSGVRDLAAMKANLDSGAEQVVDARSPARFAGSEPESRPGVEPGHIPGSRNLYYPGLFHSDGTWKRGKELAAAIEAAGVDIDRPIVTTCGSGVTAAVLTFGLHLLGRQAALYDGSWSEWGAEPTAPKELGPKELGKA
ncbi:3-mercaptopyruvate sulfurtransferase [Stakelama pacifica]|nr:3-mercaptopyruvate sulfurtransferase [Stakelama pacifica]GGO92519.1 sulfurtransferase [Stakelama pacifica]